MRRCVLVSAVLAALVATSCGTRLSDVERRAANGPFLQGGAAGTASGPSSSAEVVGGQQGSAGAAPEETGIVSSASGLQAGSGAVTEAGGTLPATQKSEIRLGSFGTSSGIVGAQLAAIPVALRAWVADVNARGGLDGHPVRFIFGGDDGSDPGRALAIARRLVEEDKVHALFGTFGGTTTPAVVPYVEEKKVALIGSVGGTPQEDASPYVFNPQQATAVGFNRNIPGAVRLMSQARKAAVMYCREAAVCTDGGRIMREYAPTLGIEVVYEAAVSLAQPDFTAEVIAARNAGAEAVMAVIDSNSFIRIIRSAHRQGWQPVFACSVACYEETFKNGGQDVEGVLALGGVSPYTVSPRMADYPAAVRRYVPGGTMGGTGAGAWVQGKLMERIAQDLGDTVTRAAVLEALWSLDGETLGSRTAPITFPRSRGRVNLCTVPIRFQNGGFVAPLGDVFYCATDRGMSRV